MDDFVRVEGGAPFFPHTCRACYSGTDLLDTIAEDAVGRVYICRRCVENGARVFGMIEGNRHAELMQADGSLRRAEQALEQKDKQLLGLIDENTDVIRAHADAVEELAGARQRIEQLEAAARAQAESALALVGVGAPGAVSFAPGEVATEAKFIDRGLPFVKSREEHDGNGSENRNEAEDTAANDPPEDGRVEEDHRGVEGDPED